MDKERVRYIITHPLTWIAASITSLATVFGAVAFDPFGATAAVITVFIDLSSPIFTAMSISAFTVLPNITVPPWLQWAVPVATIIALISGIVVVLKILSSVWDSLKARVVD